MNRFILVLSTLALMFMACSTATFATRVFPKALTPVGQEIPVTSTGTFQGCGGPLMPVINADYEQAIVEQTNEIRMKAGLSPLKRVSGLDNSSRYHVADMSNDNYFDHNTFDRTDGELVEVCDTWNRIESFYTNWVALAENIAAGQRTPEMAMDGWMNSPDHRDNILSDSYWEIGVGFYEGYGEYRFYWGQNFGKTDGRFPLVINGEKAVTNERKVSLYIYGDWDQVRLQNNDGEWSPWQEFHTNLEWELPEEAGVHTVTAEMTGRDGHTTSSSTIELVP
jgi:uncharacterized protein YkwD